MQPYNYEKENYSRSGLVYEGVTTYYGDLFLKRSGFFDLNSYLEELNLRLQKHLDNTGRFNYSVLESSYDTWLDGYVSGIPGRKTSIYDEGCLLALALDLIIRKNTNSKNSLDDVMRSLYNKFAKNNIGYTIDDYFDLAFTLGGEEVRTFYSEVVSQAISYDSVLNSLLSYAGLTIQRNPSEQLLEKKLGIRGVFANNKFAQTLCAKKI